LLRVAVALDRRQIGAVQQVQCEYNAETKELQLHLKPTQPDDDCALEIWSLDYKKDVFEAEYGVKLLPVLNATSVPISNSSLK
jgi:exopolyphosphatase/guanosine-5'-triphosphate,3'-diphosphate pyrophosphatase